MSQIRVRISFSSSSHCFLECRVREYMRRDRGAVVGRHRINAARDLQHMAQHGIRASLILADDDQCADALAVQAQILGIRHGDERFGNLLGDQAHAGRVGVQTGGKALIGEIQERHEAPAPQQFGQACHCAGSRSAPDRVVATGVNQNHVAFGRRARGARPWHRSAKVRGRIVVGVALEPQARTAQQGRVIAPGRVADVNRDGRGGRANQFRAQPQGAAAARSLHGSRAPLAASGVRRPEDQLLHGLS